MTAIRAQLNDQSTPQNAFQGIRDYLGSQGLLGCTMAGRGGVNLDVSADRASQARGVIFFAGGYMCASAAAGSWVAPPPPTNPLYWPSTGPR